MITIDPLDDEVVKKSKPERLKLSKAQQVNREQERTEGGSAKMAGSLLLALARRLLYSRKDKEES